MSIMARTKGSKTNTTEGAIRKTTRNDTQKVLLALYSQCSVRINRNSGLDKLIDVRRAAKITARRATYALGHKILPARSNVLFTKVTSGPFTRRISVGATGQALNPVIDSDEVTTNQSNSAPSGITNQVNQSVLASTSSAVHDGIELKGRSSGSQNNGDVSDDGKEIDQSDCVPKSSELLSGDVELVHGMQNNANESSPSDVKRDAASFESEHLSSGSKSNGDVSNRVMEIDQADSVPKPDDAELNVIEFEPVPGTSGMQNNGSNSVQKPNEVQQIADLSDDDDDSIVLTDTTINAKSDENKENIAPPSISPVSSDLRLLPFLPPVEMQIHVRAQHALTILDCNVPNASKLSTPMIPISSVIPPADFGRDLICMDDPSSVIDSIVPDLLNLPPPMTPLQPTTSTESRKRSIPGLIPMCDLAIKKYGPARKMSNTSQFILGVLDKFEEQKLQTDIDESDGSFGQLAYSDSD